MIIILSALGMPDNQALEFKFIFQLQLEEFRKMTSWMVFKSQ